MLEPFRIPEAMIFENAPASKWFVVETQTNWMTSFSFIPHEKLMFTLYFRQFVWLEAFWIERKEWYLLRKIWWMMWQKHLLYIWNAIDDFFCALHRRCCKLFKVFPSCEKQSFISTQIQIEHVTFETYISPENGVRMVIRTHCEFMLRPKCNFGCRLHMIKLNVLFLYRCVSVCFFSSIGPFFYARSLRRYGWCSN